MVQVRLHLQQLQYSVGAEVVEGLLVGEIDIEGAVDEGVDIEGAVDEGETDGLGTMVVSFPTQSSLSQSSSSWSKRRSVSPLTKRGDKIAKAQRIMGSEEIFIAVLLRLISI